MSTQGLLEKLASLMRDAIPPALALAVAVGLWHAASTALAKPYLFPPPTGVAQALARLLLDRELLLHIGYSLARITIGFILGVVLGLFLGVLSALSRLFLRTIYPFVVFTAVTPSIAFIPLLMLWIGLNNMLPITAITICVAFPITYSVSSSMKSIDPEIIGVARTLGAGRWMLVREIIIPLSLTHIASMLKVEAGHAWRIGFITEYLALSTGLGALMYYSYSSLRVDEVIALIIVVGLLALALQAAIERIETAVARRWGRGG